MAPSAKPKAQSTRGRSTRLGHQPEVPTEASAPAQSEGRSASKRREDKALTGARAEEGCLNMARSRDVAMNVAQTIYSRMLIHKWRVMTWGVRFIEAHRRESHRYKRNPRWLAAMFGREMASLWGHIGSGAQYIRGHHGHELTR